MHSPARQIFAVSIVSAFLLLAGCQSSSPSKAEASTKEARAPRKVRVVPAFEERVTRAVEATGTLAAQDQTQLAMKVPGRIESVLVDLGDRVTKGQVVATIDPTDLKLVVQQAEAALQQARTRLGLSPTGADDRVDPEKTATVRQARATLNEAKLNRNRAQQLFDQKLIARSEFDAANAQFEIAQGRYQDAVDEIHNRQAVLTQRKTDVELAKQQLAYGVLRSPIDGAIAERRVSAGEFVNVGAPVVTIVRINPLRLRLPVPERAAASVRVGQEVRLHTDQDDKSYFGRVTRLSPSIDETNRTLLVEAEVPNERGLLRPGAFVRAELLAQSNQPAIFVPATALVTFAGIEKVITVENGKSVEKTVRTGRKDAVKVEIAEGLKPGEQVVVRPGNLVGGQPVTVLER